MKRRSDKLFFVLCLLITAFFFFYGGRYVGNQEGRERGAEEARAEEVQKCKEADNKKAWDRAETVAKAMYKHDLKTCETWLFAAEDKINRITQEGVEAWRKECG